ncbi:peroxiredoxin [Parachlamydia sp. AcF125]|uniref:peroxiredoxin n=1 Tax=Parachlamydia sp. AcF125 TaxID=2795736 RepID=UPI001BD83DFE|nr:peroxiredoxin [Parachlamydia sp. AcF125]MBS4167721.1 putative peroxiredoxin bcp [Parachlamydia sp. AcF125]
MQYKINVGDGLPRLKAKDQEGFEVTEEDLIGSPLVLYFYPKDDTPGCTKEACEFRDRMEDLDKLNTLVVGVSPDNEESHQKFISKHKLNFTLLCDDNLELAHKFDTLRDTIENGQAVRIPERTTFVIDSDGIIRWIERPVKLEGHFDRVYRAVQKVVEDFEEGDLDFSREVLKKIENESLEKKPLS